MLCDNCGGSGHLFSAAVSRIRKKTVAFVECFACMGLGVMPMTVQSAPTAKIHAFKLKKPKQKKGA